VSARLNPPRGLILQVIEIQNQGNPALAVMNTQAKECKGRPVCLPDCPPRGLILQVIEIQNQGNPAPAVMNTQAKSVRADPCVCPRVARSLASKVIHPGGADTSSVCNSRLG